jgi:osmoprotectant transport system permease protein
MQFLLDPANWDPTISTSIPDLLIQHLIIVGIAMAFSLVIAIPLGIVVARYKPLYLPLITITGLAYTIPSMAFLAFLVSIPTAFLGLNPPTIIIPLVVYNQLVLIRNTATGINSVDPLLIEVGRAMGLTRLQILWRVTLPLAMPIIVAGIRVAAVTTIGIASISTLVGVDSLGDLIFQGFENLNNSELIAGAILISLLAIFADLLLLSLQVALNRGRTITAATA